MDSYIQNLELEFEHWLSNVLPQKLITEELRLTFAVGYYGGRIDGATCRDEYSAETELFKKHQNKLKEHLL